MQKLTAMGELVSTTTHRVQQRPDDDHQLRQAGVEAQGQRQSGKMFREDPGFGEPRPRITSGVLAMARNRSPGQEPTDLAQLLEDTLLLLERELNKYRITVEKQFQPIPKACVAGNQIQQVLLNLLINARQAMPNGGRLLIRLSHDTENGTIDLLIRDHGCGIPADKLPHIFDPFFTTKSGPDASGKGGTGLGLSMCRDIIEAHHGRIRVETAVGKGTAFTLKLPTAPAKTNERAAPAAPTATPAGSVVPPNVIV